MSTGEEERTEDRDTRIFAKMKEEALELRDSPLLGPTVESEVLKAKDLVSVIAAVLAVKLEMKFLPYEPLREICAKYLENDENLGADVEAVVTRDPASISYLQVVLFIKGFHATQSHRVAAKLWTKGTAESKAAALAIQSRCSEVFGVDIHPAARIGGGLMIDHATGVVIGETAVVGDDCTILHGVTLGGTGRERGDRHPKIGNHVTLGAGATVLGNIIVGDGAIIGSQAVVTKQVPPGMTVVSLNKILDPAKQREKSTTDHPDTWQYEIEFNSTIHRTSSYSFFDCPDDEDVSPVMNSSPRRR